MLFNRLEFSGSLGDLGTLLPLGIAGIMASFLLLNHKRMPAAVFVVGGGLLLGKPLALAVNLGVAFLCGIALA